MKKAQVFSRVGQVNTQDCTKMIGNMFDMILVASQRARELARVANRNASEKPIISALIEIQNGEVGMECLSRIR